ncbi:MAG: class F sortase [Nitriliruptorales bacterium]|nr:class F sortase [Nitriliruptorales bacterium]
MAGCAAPETTTAEAPPPATAPESPSPSSDEPAPDPPVEVADPATVSIPAIDVHATLVDLGLEDDGAMEVPDFGLAGWYIEGPRPGEDGPAVVAAHVDSKEGPDVFYRLGELEPGDEVTVTDLEGAEHTFTVERTEQHDKNELPVDDIWSATDSPTLRLITCGGEFDRSIGHYDDNIIVWATAA